jgi:hypothetical protein
MAHWAQIDENNVVIQVTVGNNNEPDEGYQWLIDNIGGRWLKTSYNASGGKKRNPETGEFIDEPGFRKNFAGPGYYYSDELDAFIPPKPEDIVINNKTMTWLLNEDTCIWEPSID